MQSRRPIIIDLQEQNLPLDKVLQPRQNGKKMPEHQSNESSESDEVDPLLPKKIKPISKQKNQPLKPIPHHSSTDLATRLVFNAALSMKQMRQTFINLSEIKSLKYDKFSQKIRQNLVETNFSNSYPKFIKIIDNYHSQICSTHLLHSIFHGFELAWSKERFDCLEYFTSFFKLYCESLPNCLNKRFAKFIKETAQIQKDHLIFMNLRKIVLEYVENVMKGQNNKLRSSQSESQKIIPLVIYFQLQSNIKMKQMVKVVPLQKVNQYIDNSVVKNNSTNLNLNQKQKSLKVNKINQKQRLMEQTFIQEEQFKVPSMIHHTILQLISYNDLKQIQKIIKSHKIPYENYPALVQKLEVKYLEYISRTYPIFMVDELIQNKISLVQNVVDIYLQRRKYQQADHFIHKYRLRGVQKADTLKIFKSPLIVQDSFGPTESHVLNSKSENHYICLKDFNIHKTNIVWIDTLTIFQKPYTTHLKKLLTSQQVGLDSQSTSGIHVFDKGKLQLIQIYEPQINMAFLFDVRDFKDDKKKRHNRNNNEGKRKVKSQKLSNNQPINSFSGNKQKQKSFEGPIILENSKQQERKEQSQHSSEQQNRAWYRFSKIIQNLFKNSTIYGHSLHSDLGEIITQLGLNVKATNIKVRDSQVQFKKFFPQQKKSNLSFLAQKCFGKQISKYQQCSAWDKRPLRKAQKHYASLDAVLPYKLVKWMEQSTKQKK